MPSRFFDYESDLFNLSRKNEDKPKTGLRRPAEQRKPRRSSASEPSSAGSTRSSVSSTGSSIPSSPTWRTGHHPARSTGVLTIGSHNLRDPHRTEQVEPTAQVQEWAHQMHMQQQKQYWWCSACYPKTPVLQIPTKKAMKRVRIAEPTHAYE